MHTYRSGRRLTPLLPISESFFLDQLQTARRSLNELTGGLPGLRRALVIAILAEDQFTVVHPDSGDALDPSDVVECLSWSEALAEARRRSPDAIDFIGTLGS